MLCQAQLRAVVVELSVMRTWSMHKHKLSYNYDLFRIFMIPKITYLRVMNKFSRILSLYHL